MATDWPAPGEHRETHTGRFRVATAAALAAAAVGVLARRPGLLLVAAVGAVAGVSARLARPPAASLSLDRNVATEDPAPGEAVSVTVTVRNDGTDAVPELRLYDGVPEGGTVVDGSPRLATALEPGASARTTYTVRLPAGEHAVRPALAVLRDGTGAAERALRVGEGTAVSCAPSFEPAEPVPVRAATPLAGGRAAESGGAGVTFYASREYRRGDPPARIDWHRRARTGELASLQFRERRTASVLVCVDAGASARCAPEPDAATALERSVEGASRVLATLAERGDRTGVATLDAEVWLAPGGGSGHRARLRAALGEVPEASGEADPGELAGRLPPGTQVLLFSGLCSGAAADCARRLAASGAGVTVLSPDPTAARTPGQRLLALERRQRVEALCRAGVSVVAWPPDMSLDEALAVAEGGPRPGPRPRSRSSPGGSHSWSAGRAPSASSPAGRACWRSRSGWPVPRGRP
jgi:uncharacterized repeat protein (TIGR01451 family)